MGVTSGQVDTWKVDEILSTMRHDVTSVETNLEESKSKLATDTDHAASLNVNWDMLFEQGMAVGVVIFSSSEAINALNGRIDFTNKDLSATQDSERTPNGLHLRSSFLLLVVRPGAPSSVLAPSSDALCS